MSSSFHSGEELNENEVEAILCRFGYLIDTPDASHEVQLAQIRDGLEGQLGRPVQLDEPLVRGAWDINASQWDRFCYWAAMYSNLPKYDERERDYKLLVAERIGQFRNSVLAESDTWQSDLRRALASPNNILHQITKAQFIAWCDAQPNDAKRAFRRLWNSDADIRDRIAGFVQELPDTANLKTPGNRVALSAMFLVSEDPTNYTFFLPSPFAHGYRITHYTPSHEGRDAPGEYASAHEFLDRILEETAKRGLQLRDRLDAQSVLWCITRWAPHGEWPEIEIEHLHRFREGLPPLTEREQEIETDPLQPTPDDDTDSLLHDTLEDLADDLLLDVGSLRDMCDLLEHRRQAIFFGPPGTGKTYVAMRLAKFLAGCKERVDLVQFHAAYAYEDFVEGFRPREVNGAPGFRLEDGPLKRIAERARAAPDQTHVLIIDEINRANIARVFGELYFLLEYRGERINLQYSAEPFSLPRNLLIIGTMNTADRSIALLDAALRRRFYFIPFFPMEPPIAGLLQRWLERHASDMTWVADVVDEANGLLDDRDGGIGPSYFMSHGSNLNERWVELIWKHQIMPYLEEHFFGAPDRLDDFQLDRLRDALTASGPEEAGDPDAVQTDTE